MKAERVKRFVDQRIRYMFDMDQYGIIEYWVDRTDEILDNKIVYGDCEDYCIAYINLLISQEEIPKEDIYLVLCRFLNEDVYYGHAVVFVKDGDRILVLDNTIPNKVVYFSDIEDEFILIRKMNLATPGIWQDS